MPNASIVNFVPGFNIANGLIQPICDAGVTTCTHDLSIYAASDVNVVADVMGYFRRFPIEGSGSIPALEARIAALEAKLDGLTRSGTDFVITNANLYIQSGSGATAEATNGKGNLIIGYNESRGEGMDIRTGSHNLIVGSEHNYNSSGGIVVGVKNTISSISASVTTSYNNTASGTYSSVSGGGGNTASGLYSSVTAGYGNTASGTYSSVSGGGSNTASGGRCSVSGGYNRSAPNDDDWAAGALWQDQ